jgi:hypothetical protein
VVGGWGGAEPNPTKPPTATKPAAAIITMTMAAKAIITMTMAATAILTMTMEAKAKDTLRKRGQQATGKSSFMLFFNNKQAKLGLLRYYYLIKVCFYLFGIKASRTLKGITQTISNRFNLPM